MPIAALIVDSPLWLVIVLVIFGVEAGDLELSEAPDNENEEEVIAEP